MAVLSGARVTTAKQPASAGRGWLQSAEKASEHGERPYAN